MRVGTWNVGSMSERGAEVCEELRKRREEARTTKEDVEDASGKGEQECWFEEGGAMNRARWRVEVGEIAVRVG